MTSREIEMRRAKGLCYWCPEKYVAGHRCRGKQLFVIEVGEDDEEEQETDFSDNIEVEPTEAKEEY